jgi:hypothetical protein
MAAPDPTTLSQPDLFRLLAPPSGLIPPALDATITTLLRELMLGVVDAVAGKETADE